MAARSSTAPPLEGFGKIETVFRNLMRDAHRVDSTPAFFRWVLARLSIDRTALAALVFLSSGCREKGICLGLQDVKIDPRTHTAYFTPKSTGRADRRDVMLHIARGRPEVREARCAELRAAHGGEVPDFRALHAEWMRETPGARANNAYAVKLRHQADVHKRSKKTVRQRVADILETREREKAYFNAQLRGPLTEQVRRALFNLAELEKQKVKNKPNAEWQRILRLHDAAGSRLYDAYRTARQPTPLIDSVLRRTEWKNLQRYPKTGSDLYAYLERNARGEFVPFNEAKKHARDVGRRVVISRLRRDKLVTKKQRYIQKVGDDQLLKMFGKKRKRKNDSDDDLEAMIMRALGENDGSNSNSNGRSNISSSNSNGNNSNGGFQRLAMNVKYGAKTQVHHVPDASLKDWKRRMMLEMTRLPQNAPDNVVYPAFRQKFVNMLQRATPLVFDPNSFDESAHSYKLAELTILFRTLPPEVQARLRAERPEAMDFLADRFALSAEYDPEVHKIPANAALKRARKTFLNELKNKA